MKGFLDYDKSLACIHCGLCLGACPTFLESGNENDSPRGRIYLMRSIQDGRLPLNATTVSHIDRCLGCLACQTACPSGVHYGTLLESTRHHIEQNHVRPAFQRFLRRIAIEQVFPYPNRMKLAVALGRYVPKSLVPPSLRDALTLLPERANSTPVPERSPAEKPTGQRVGFISGCVQSVLFGDTNAASIRLLNRAGFEVLTPAEQGCCGALYAHTGNLEDARDAARRNIAVFERLRVDLIIINAAGCGSTLKEYGELLREDPEWAERARQFTAKVRDLVEIIPPSLFANRGSGLVTYHDACHLAHPQHITRQPRDLVRAVAGDRYVELPESDTCCGSAGSYNLTEPEMAGRLQNRKIQNILKTGAQIVVTTNPGCLLQIRAGLQKAGATHVKAMHIADFLDQATG